MKIDNKVPIPIRCQILRSEIQRWENTAYMWETRAKVNKRIGERLEAIKKELEKCEQALDMLREELAELDPLSKSPG